MYVGSLTGTRTNYFTGAGNHLLIGPILNSTNGAPISLTKTGTGTLTLGGASTFSGTATVDMGDGTLPLSGVPFTVTASAGSLGLILNAVALPTATVTAGSITLK